MRYYTLKSEVPLEPGQRIGFEPGRGYHPTGIGHMGERKDDTPFNRPVGGPPHTSPPSSAMLRAEIMKWAYWGIANRDHWDYTMGAARLSMYHRKPGDLSTRIEADCSAAVSGLYKWGGATDPNKLGFGGDPYTGTLLAAMTEISAIEARPADLIVYGGGTGEHVSMILQRINPSDFWTFSHGHQGAPDHQLHSGMAAWMAQHGHPGVRFLRSLD
jgi:hypothetical protein